MFLNIRSLILIAFVLVHHVLQAYCLVTKQAVGGEKLFSSVYLSLYCHRIFLTGKKLIIYVEHMSVKVWKMSFKTV